MLSLTQLLSDAGSLKAAPRLAKRLLLFIWQLPKSVKVRQKLPLRGRFLVFCLSGSNTYPVFHVKEIFEIYSKKSVVNFEVILLFFVCQVAIHIDFWWPRVNF